MKVIHRKPADYLTTPWKNGGGSTTQLAIYPPFMTVNDPFLWRLSRASLGASGPFSVFPGYERHIMQLEGGVVCLDHGDHGTRALTIEVPYVFSGDWSTYGSLDHGPAQDLNLMVRRSSASGTMRVYRLQPDEVISRPISADFTLLVALRGLLDITSPRSLNLLSGESLIMERETYGGEEQRESQARSTCDLKAVEAATLVWVEIEKVHK